MKLIKIIIIALLGIIAGELPGQEGNSIQAMQAQLKEATGKNRINLLNQLADALKNKQVSTAIAYANDAYKESKASGYKEGILASAILLGQNERNNGKGLKASNFAEEAIKMAQALNLPYKELEARGLLVEALLIRKKKKRAADEDLLYQKLKNELALANRNAQYENLQDNYEQKQEELGVVSQENQQLSNAKARVERQLNLTLEESLRQEASLARLDQEKAELEAQKAILEREKAEDELALSQKEKAILEYDAKVQKQQLFQTILIGGLVALALIILLIIRNYRLRKTQDEERSALQKQIEMQEKMATLGQLTAGIAHEIKNPLNFVNNFAEGSTFLLDDLEETLEEGKASFTSEQQEEIEELTTELRKNAEDIKHHGQRVDRIVKSMMEHTRTGKGRVAPTNINQLLSDNIDLAYHGYRANHPDFKVDIVKDFADSIPELKVIPQDLSRVFINMINNSCYAVHERLKASENGYIPAINCSTFVNGNWIEIHILDNGIGIGKEDRTKVFNPFFTTKPTGAGNTGLGLSISYDIIVQTHEGTLEVESEEGAYTKFTIQLPKGN